MRTLARNRQSLKYSLQTGKVPIYMRDDEGNIIYITVDGEQVPVESGEYENGYSLPVDFKANIAMSGGDTQIAEYGLDVSAYDATIVYNRGQYPITETSLIWFQTEPKFKDDDNTIVDGKSADYTVVKVSDSLNFTKVILKKIIK